MKICFWLGSYFKLGGTSRVVTVLSNELVKTHDITFFISDNPKNERRSMYGLDEKVELTYYKVKDYQEDEKSVEGMINSYRRFKNHIKGTYNKEEKVDTLKNAFYPSCVINKWSDYFNGTGYDIIVAAGFHILTLAIMKHEGKINSKAIGWQHNSYKSYVSLRNKMFWKKQVLLKKYLPALDKFVLLNKYDSMQYLNRLSVESMPIDNSLSFKSEEKTDQNKLNFLVAARFVPQKGLDLLLKSFALFCKHKKNWNLIIAGDGVLRNRIIKAIWKNRLQRRVRLIGTTNNIKKYYLKSSVYLLTSKWEGWGLVITEAFEMGLPVIAYDITPIDLIIDNGENGIIVEKFDYVKYAAAMLKLANDEELRKKMAASAIEKAKQYDVEKVAGVWNGVFSEVVK